MDMRLSALAAIAALTAAPAAFADHHGDLGGHSYEVSSANGTATVTFSGDGAYTMTNADGASTGAWTLSEGELCVTPTVPEGTEGPGTLCGGWTPVDVGGSFTSTDWSENGEELTITRIR